MPALGKTGADAIFHFLRRICGTLTRYQSKLLARINELEADTTISSAQATSARLLVNSASAFCDVFSILAANTNIN